MKAWLKGGLIGGGIGILYIIYFQLKMWGLLHGGINVLDFIALLFIGGLLGVNLHDPLPIQKEYLLTLALLIYYLLIIIIYFILGSIIGLIVGKIRGKNERQKKEI